MIKTSRSAVLVLAATGLAACSSVSLTYEDMSEDPTLKGALWLVVTTHLPEAAGGQTVVTEALWLTDLRDPCEDQQTYTQDQLDFIQDGEIYDLSDQDECDSYIADLETLFETRPDTEWEMTISAGGDGTFDDGEEDFGEVGGPGLNLLHYVSDPVEAMLADLGEDCQGDDNDNWEDAVDTLVAEDGEVELDEAGEDAWTVSLTDVDLKEPGDNDDEGSLSGDFTAELCEIEVDYSDSDSDTTD